MDERYPIGVAHPPARPFVIPSGVVGAGHTWLRGSGIPATPGKVIALGVIDGTDSPVGSSGGAEATGAPHCVFRA